MAHTVKTSQPTAVTRRVVAVTEIRGELVRFALFCRFACVLWVFFAPISMFIADRYYGNQWTGFLPSRAIGLGALLAGTQLGKAAWINTPGRVGLVTGLIAGTCSLIIGYEAASLGGLASPYVVGPAFPMVALAILQRHWHDVAPPLLATATAYFVGLFAALWGQVDLLAAPTVYIVVAEVSLLGLLAVFCTVLAHVGWQLRRQLYESRSIGRYQLKRLLGKGGMGEVWAAYHSGLKREVAVKILRGEKVDEESVKRFEREVRATSALAHPNTIRVFDYGVTDDGLWYYAMELLHGISFARLIESEGRQPEARAVHLIAQAARAIGEAHRAGIVHRDLKPENLLITQAGGEPDFVKVIDFGIARQTADADLTGVGLVAGTPNYMAPEVAAGGQASSRADVYSLGAVLYFLVTGSPPFRRKTGAETMTAHLTAPIPSARADNAEVSPDLDKVIATCLAKHPDQRYADGTALATALAERVPAPRWAPSRPFQVPITPDGDHDGTADFDRARTVDAEPAVDGVAAAANVTSVGRPRRPSDKV